MASRLSLNLATIRPAPLERKLQAASAAAFGAVGLLVDEMLSLGAPGEEAVRASGLAVSDLGALAGWMGTDRAARGAALARAKQAVGLAARLPCPLVIAHAAREEMEVTAAAAQFRELCQLAAQFQVRVGLEFVGFAPPVDTLAAAWEIVEAAEAENGGLVLDTFHFYRGGSTLEMLERVPGSRLLLVQVADAADIPRRELANRHRVYPGEGAVPLEPILAALSEKGYRGYYSLELQNEDYWRENPVVVAREGLRSLRRLGVA